jgi:hypothetical protein
MKEKTKKQELLIIFFNPQTAAVSERRWRAPSGDA